MVAPAYRLYEFGRSDETGCKVWLISRGISKPGPSYVRCLENLASSCDFSNFSNCLQDLEDVVLLWDVLRQSMSIWRGGSAKCRVYFAIEKDCLRVATQLDRFQADLDPEAMLRGVSTSVRGPYEPIGDDCTVLQGVHRARPGFLTCVDLATNRISAELISYERFGEAPPRSIGGAIRRVEEILLERCQSVADLPGDVGLELSGGLDSSLSGIMWLRSGGKHISQAWSIIYPYFEFRNEEKYICLARDAVQPTTNTRVDGTNLLVLGKWSEQIRPLEPSLAMYGLSQGNALYDFMDGHSCAISLNGNGGDTLFALGRCNLRDPWEKWVMPDWIYGRSEQLIKDSIGEHRKYFSSEEGRHSLYYAGLTVDDAWVEQQFEPYFTCRRFSPLIDARLLPLADYLTSCEKSKRLPPKWPLRVLLSGKASKQLRSRYGKVAYDGLYVRGYSEAFGRLEALIDRHQDEIDQYGINPKRFRSAVAEQTARVRPDEHAIASVIAHLLWLDSRNCENIRFK